MGGRLKTVLIDIQFVRENDYPGTFIVVEGADGAGTTTQSKKLAEELDAYWTREPAGNLIGEKVEGMISSGDYSSEAVALGFAADRMIHLEDEVIPKLESGEIVVCDRYYHSSMVYQPVSGVEFEWVKELNGEAVRPDFTAVLDVSADEGMGRVKDRGEEETIYEELSFQEKVVAGYRKLEQDLNEDIEFVDASQSVDDVFSDLQKVFDRKFD